MTGPARVADVERYWGEPPPERSPRCAWWLARIEAGARPSRRVQALGYYGAAEACGVYIWEWCHVLWPAIEASKS